jgi:hypothetical protein
LIDLLVKQLKTIGRFDLTEVFGTIRSENRSLELTENRLWEMGYGSDTIHLIFNLWYSFNYTPSYDNNLPQVDHIFPQSLLRKVKMKNPDNGKMNLTRYKADDRDQLANCMLLTAAENGAGGKSDTAPDQWFKDKTDEYLDRHLIPKDAALWKLEQFGDFIVARQALIREKFKYLLAGTSTVAT